MAYQAHCKICGEPMPEGDYADVCEKCDKKING